MKRILCIAIAVFAVTAVLGSLAYAATPADTSAQASVGGSVTVSSVWSLPLTDEDGSTGGYIAPTFTGSIDAADDVPYKSEPYGTGKSSIYLVAKNNYNSTDVPAWYIKLSATASGDVNVSKLWYFIGRSAATNKTEAYNRNTGNEVATDGLNRTNFVGAADKVGDGWKQFSGTATTLYTSQTEDRVNTQYGTIIGLPIGIDQRGMEGSTSSVSTTFSVTAVLTATP